MRSSRAKSKKGCGCSAKTASGRGKPDEDDAWGGLLDFFKQAAGWKYTRKAQRASQARMKSRIVDASRRQRPRSRRGRRRRSRH